MRSLALILMLFACAGWPGAMGQHRVIAKQHDTCAAHAGVRVPAYTIVRRINIPGVRASWLFVSVDPSHIHRDDLIAVGCALGKRFAGNDGLSAWIFNDNFAASHYNPQGEGNSKLVVAALQGNYGFVRDQKLAGQYLRLRTYLNSSDLDVEIELGSPPPPPIVVTGPTLVAFFAGSDDKPTRNPDDGQALADFQLSVQHARAALRSRGVAFVVLYTHSFELRIAEKVTTIECDKIGVGYYLIAPGKKPLLASGVMTDADLLQQADKYFGTQPNP